MAEVNLSTALHRQFRNTPTISLQELEITLGTYGIGITQSELERALSAAGAEPLAGDPTHWRMAQTELEQEQTRSRGQLTALLTELVNYHDRVARCVRATPAEDEEGTPQQWRRVATEIAKVQRSADRIEAAIASAREYLKQ